mgnify:CR=1 FL=1
MRRYTIRWLMVCSLAGLTGGAAAREKTARENVAGQDAAPVESAKKGEARDAAADDERPARAPVPSESGSLWSDAGYQSFLYYDRKAKTVGDLVTIKIVEASQATRSASTSLERSSSLEAGISGMFGLESKVKQLAPSINPSALLGASTGNSFQGDGATTRSGSLTATITARVVKVLANGNLLVLGQQEVKINQELQVLTLRGMVRPQDIQIDNVILSTYIADARIEYTGTGVVAEKQRPGWMGRAVDRVWPF